MKGWENLNGYLDNFLFILQHLYNCTQYLFLQTLVFTVFAVTGGDPKERRPKMEARSRDLRLYALASGNRPVAVCFTYTRPNGPASQRFRFRRCGSGAGCGAELGRGGAIVCPTEYQECLEVLTMEMR